jgi:hypothetical protein
MFLEPCFNRAYTKLKRKYHEVSAKPKPKRPRRCTEDLEVLAAKQPVGGKIVRAHGDSLSAKPTDNGKVPRRRNPANKTKKKAKTANELMLEVWKYTWENRHRRLTKP